MTIEYDRQHQYLIQDLVSGLLKIKGLEDYLGYEYNTWLQLNAGEKKKF